MLVGTVHFYNREKRERIAIVNVLEQTGEVI